MRRLVDLYCLLAGACDASTGVLLVTAPAFTLGLMGIAPPPAEPVYLRWIGVFVGSVGLLYLYPLVLGSLQRRRTVLEATALVRLAVAAFVLVSVLRGELAGAWISVFVTDLTLAAAQLLLLRRWPREESTPEGERS